ncbi:FAD-linked oxidase C-terminal domain-containing protein [Streptomyces avermitilis]|uniref:FAD-binding oxidoreductase n=1 Tax=Streptomyces avermitilis TaxID=33903 RepID=UPI0033E66749
MCCAKYGVTADHVASLTAVLADGRVIRTGPPTRKNVAGLDLTRLLVGSEGTLAVIVDATVRLRPFPAATATVVAAFPTPQQARDAGDRAGAAFDDIVAAALALGGTITGEHGVGSLKTRYLDAQLGPTERALMTGIKAVFDPEGLLDPGRAY